MDFNWNPFNRDRNSILLLRALTAGLLLGISSFLGKIVMSTGFTFDIFFFSTLILNPFVWLLPITGITGFLFVQNIIHKKRVSVTVSVTEGFVITTSVLLSLIFLGETISVIKWIGILLVIMAAVGIGRD